MVANQVSVLLPGDAQPAVEGHRVPDVERVDLKNGRKLKETFNASRPFL